MHNLLIPAYLVLLLDAYKPRSATIGKAATLRKTPALGGVGEVTGQLWGARSSEVQVKERVSSFLSYRSHRQLWCC
jgi:hypothetical protein